MPLFQHHPDNIIYINATAMPLEFWLTLEPGYSLPDGFIGRYYEPEVRHFLRQSNKSIPQELVWAEGGGYIANEATYAAAWQAYQDSLVVPPTQAEIDAAARRSETKTQFQQLTTGLGGLSTADRSYAITARIMAFKDGASNATILGITNRASAAAYVQSKPEWAGITAATKAWETDMLETLAGIVQVLMLVLE